MNKILLIIQREYLTRVRKRSFIIMTIIGPLLFGSIMIIPAFVSQMSDETRTVAVLDENGLPGESPFFNVLKDSEKLHFAFLTGTIDDAKAHYKENGYYAVLHIPQYAVDEPDLIKLWSDQKVNYLVIDNIQNQLRKEIESQRLKQEIHSLNLGPGYENYDKELLSRTNVKLNIQVRDINTGEKSMTEVSMIAGLFGGMLIYFFIFMFGSQVMRGVIEEKTNRIVEVIVSSVKPFQLMMGKIIGLALVGLTQFLLWIVFTLVILGGAAQVFPDNFKRPEAPMLAQQAQPNGIAQEFAAPAEGPTEAATAPPAGFQVWAILDQIPVGTILFSFLFYFIFGYLMYAALFGAIGSAVDSEADTQQFMLPVTIPLIFSIVMLTFIMNNPHGPVAWWLSMIPLTSPVVMMIRMPFDPPVLDIVLSMGFLVLGWLGATWLAGKIYRTGILMYGKKPTWGELIKWARVK